MPLCHSAPLRAWGDPPGFPGSSASSWLPNIQFFPKNVARCTAGHPSSAATTQALRPNHWLCQPYPPRLQANTLKKKKSSLLTLVCIHPHVWGAFFVSVALTPTHGCAPERENRAAAACAPLFVKFQRARVSPLQKRLTWSMV